MGKVVMPEGLHLAATLAESGAPAVAGLVLAHDRVLEAGALGVRRLGWPEPMLLSDKIHIGSNAKGMTATLVACLVANGQLDWDSKPVDLLPQLAGQLAPAYDTITLEQLLRHTAGLPAFTEEEEFHGLPDFTGGPRAQRLAFAQWLLAQPPKLNPGTEFSYSNAGYGVVAALLEAYLDEDWDRLLQQYLLAPLGIEAGVGWPGADGSAQPWGHMAAAAEAPLEPVDPIHHEYKLPAIIAPAGDLHLSLPDYGTFLQMNLSVLHGHDTPLPLQPSATSMSRKMARGWGGVCSRFLATRLASMLAVAVLSSSSVLCFTSAIWLLRSLPMLGRRMLNGL